MRSLILGIAITLALPAAVFAGTPRPWLALNGSWATYSMSDVNADIRNINAQLAGSGLTMDEIGHGLGFGVAGGVETAGPVSLGLGYERLSASSEVSDASGGIRYHFPANSVRAFVEYRFPSETNRSPSVGFAVGRVMEAGSVDVTITGAGAVSAHLDGSGPLLEAFVGGDWWSEPQFALFGSAGYRYAKVGEVKLEGQTVINPDGSKYSMDYSGVVIRLGFKAALSR